MSDEELAREIYEHLHRATWLPKNYGAHRGVCVLRGFDAVEIDGIFDLTILAAHIKNLLATPRDPEPPPPLRDPQAR